VVVEPTGSGTELVVQCGGVTLTVVVHGRSGLRPGERVSLAPSPDDVHLFDATSGARL